HGEETVRPGSPGGARRHRPVTCREPGRQVKRGTSPAPRSPIHGTARRGDLRYPPPMSRRVGWTAIAALALFVTGPVSPAAAKRCAPLCRAEIAACKASCTTQVPRRQCRRACRVELLRACRATLAPSCTAPAPAGRQIVVNGLVLDAQGLAVIE